MTQQTTPKTREAEIAELRSDVVEHRMAAIDYLEADMFYTAKFEADMCIDITHHINRIIDQEE